MQHRENIMLYKVLNNEVVFQEYFCNLLNINEFRKQFIDFISIKNPTFTNLKIEHNDFDTEVSLGEKGRADLFLTVNNKKYIFEIKNKEYTSLTDSQPISYLKYVKENEQLFFLIPKNYNHKEEIKKRWKEYNNNFNQIENQFIYWEDFILYIDNNIKKQKKEVKMFSKFCKYWFDMEMIKFKRKEMKLLKNKDLPKLMNKLEDITRKIGEEVDFNNKLNTIGFSYSKIIGNYRLYVGIDYDLWEKKNMPISIFIQNHKNGYGNFELTLENIKLEKIKWEESSYSDLQFGYVVILEDTIGSESFEETLISSIEDIKDKLINK